MNLPSRPSSEGAGCREIRSFGETFIIDLFGREFRRRFALPGSEFGLFYMAATLASAATLPWIAVPIIVIHQSRNIFKKLLLCPRL
jgi:hypothetical protein